MHLGLVMVDPALRGRGLSSTLYGLTCVLMFLTGQGRALWVSNVSQVPAIAAATLCGELATVYPYELTELNQVSQVPRFGIGHWSVETVWVYPQTA